jgi:hypothetical protein
MPPVGQLCRSNGVRTVSGPTPIATDWRAEIAAAGRCNGPGTDTATFQTQP